MTIRTLSLAALGTACITAAPLALAQQGEGIATPAQGMVFVGTAPPVMPLGGGPIEILSGNANVMGGLVTGKPYSADAITESVQMLADGNRIVVRNETRLFRDGQGRTRREQTVNGLGVWQTGSSPTTFTTIVDPVSGESYFLDPQARTARRLPSFRLAAEGVAGAPPLPPLPALPGARADVGVAQRVDVEGAPPSGRPILRNFITSSLASPPSEMEVVTEDLGEQVLEGLVARGVRETRTIPAGAIGNEREISIVHESWFAPVLDAIVLQRNIDPRFGETTYRLIHVVQGEPDPELFTVPSDYTLNEEPAIQVDVRGVGEESAPGPGGRIERRVLVVQPEYRNEQR